MLRLIAITLVGLVLITQAAKYTTKYDNIDLDEILSNDRLLTNYADCLIKDDKEAKCTPDAAELKKILPDALTSGCESCNEKQKEGSKKVLNYLIDNKPEIWKNLQAKYDPTGEYTKKYKAQVRP